MPPHSLPNDYVRVSVELFDNPKLADVADEHGPVVYTVWLHLLVTAKRARHLGRVIASPVRVARAVGIEVRQAAAILEALEGHRAIVAVGERDHHYQLRNWTRWQSMTPAERIRKHREKGGSVTEGVTPETAKGDGVAGSVTKKRKQSRAEQRREEGTNVPCAVAEPATPTMPPEPDPVDVVYQGWREAQRATGGAVPRKLTADRRTRIKARLAEGYTPDELLLAIRAFMADPFHLGKNDRGTRYTDIVTLLKNAGKVDAGLQLAQAQAGAAASSDASRSRYVRPAS